MLTDITTLTDTDLIDSIHTAHDVLTRHKARFIIGLAEFHDRALAREQGAPSTVVWLGRHHGMSRSSAFEYLSVGARLRAHPRLAREFLHGRVSYSKVRLLRRYVTEDNEDELVDLAVSLTYPELEQALIGRPRAEGRKKQTNTFKIVQDEETGGSSFWGSLDAEHTAELFAVLKLGELSFLRDLADLDPDILRDPEAVDAEIQAARREAEQDTPLAALPAGSVEGAEGETPGESGQPGMPSPAAPTRFGPPSGNGLFSAFLGVINMVRTSPQNKLRAPGAQVNVMVTLDGRVVIPDRFGAETASMMRSILNGEICLHLLDKKGLHVKLSRSARTVSPAQEKALLALWGYRCAMPGCPHTRFLEFHHIVEWSKGGTTDLDNLIPLCSGCHALVTVGQVTIHVDEINPQLLRFRFPGGQSYTSEARGLPVGNAQMGRWADRYIDGAAPRGDEHLLQIWDNPDSFDDPDEGAAHGHHLG